MTLVKRQTTPNRDHHEVFFAEGIWKELWVSVFGIGHSDIRGFGLLLTYRSMVRRERYRLKAWITVFCAIIVVS